MIRLAIRHIPYSFRDIQGLLQASAQNIEHVVSSKDCKVNVWFTLMWHYVFESNSFNKSAYLIWIKMQETPKIIDTKANTTKCIYMIYSNNFSLLPNPNPISSMFLPNKSEGTWWAVIHSDVFFPGKQWLSNWDEIAKRQWHDWDNRCCVRLRGLVTHSY